MTPCSIPGPLQAPARSRLMPPAPSAWASATQLRPAIYIPRDWPRQLGAQQLVHSVPPWPNTKSASTSIEGNACGMTALVSMSVPSMAVAAPMPHSAAWTSILPPRRRSNHLPLFPPNPPPLHPLTPPLSPQSPSPSPPHSPSPSVWHVPQPPSTHAPLTYIPHPHSQSTSTPAPTPINVHALSHLLSALPQQQWVDYLLPGFTYGFLLATRASALLATLPTSHQQLPVQR